MVFDNDVFLGARWARNDEADTAVLGGPVIDLDTGEALAFLEAERRVGSRWTFELEARWFLHTDTTSPLNGLRRDGFATVRLSRWF